MPDKITVKRIAAALKRVPEKKFRIVELAPGLVNRAGRPDVAKCIEMEEEINLAVVEVGSYIKAVSEITENLQGLGRGQRLGGDDIDDDYLDEPDEDAEEGNDDDD